MSAELAGAIRRSVDGPMWHGSPLGEILAGIRFEQADARPLPKSHTIWEIVLHVTLWTDVARRRVLGERVVPSSAEDWASPADQTESAWERDRLRLRSSHEELANVVASLSAERLDARVAGHDYSVRTMLHGVIEHDCYHGGQIALIKKSFQE